MVTATLSRHVVAQTLGGSVGASHGTDLSASDIEEILRSAEAFAQRWLRRTALELAMPARRQRDNELGATAFLSLASAVASGWIGARLTRETSNDPVSKHLAAAGKFAITDMTRRLPFLSGCALEGADTFANFGDLL